MFSSETTSSGFLEKLPVYARLSDTHKRILQRLWELSSPDNQYRERTASKLGEFLGWTAQTTVTYVDRLIEEVKAYNGTHMNDAVILQIHQGGKGSIKDGNNYLVEIIRKETKVDEFWKAHVLGEGIPVVLVTNAPLFFLHPSGKHRIRVMEVNKLEARDEHLKAKRKPDLEGYRECFHYLSIGDFRLAIALGSHFVRRNCVVDARVVIGDRNLSDPYNPMDEVNLRETRSIVALGNPRVSWVVDSMLATMEPNFYVDKRYPSRIRNRHPEPNEQEWYEDNLASGGHLYAVLVRKRENKRTETVMLVQNGPALEALAGVLTDHKAIQEQLFEDPRWISPLPDYFECLFRVSLGNNEVVARSTRPELLAVRMGHWSRAKT